jgi:hypothetical protein
MIDSKVFNELINHGIITHVGLKPENYKDIADLHKYGLATRIDAGELYEELISELGNTESPAMNLDTKSEDVKDAEDTNDAEDAEGESKDIIVDDNAE